MSQYLINVNQKNPIDVNQINIDDSIQTMSSREIAELCGKRHDNVMRDIKNILLELYDEKDILKFEGIFFDSMNRQKTEYLLPKRECLILVSGYSIALRAKIIDRWQELEKQVTPPQIDYSSPQAMIGFLNYLQGQIDQKDTIIAELKPKAIALDGLTRSDGLFGIIDAAKILEVRPKDLSDYLRRYGWVYKRVPSGPLLPYQDKIQKGLMDCTTITIQKNDGTEKTVPSTKITTKGLAFLREQLYGNMQ
ncbi:phage regulatory protein/antirepressor Ant [Bartonella krasnovii]|uniref:Phage regulatory protein/antirepressor Ant n=1 Tax=Bartonella krasnovii TaxID=2267275 RepID=A0A5B9D1T0_9HYPH|nr:phage regulatory protein/antirepressor Ant [Bartonella krasnovii]QEE11924.1 phage regulatory protein/antirepressor Ant [Bartonella krasnovii]UNF42742.1 phage regulatory protein/antirepressor Ant [Bartonella krasnovii]UNF54240.1 phage regulatory protein/antirepressor Ant [Bartonella krasnovii]UNF55952.1 phage regulatory protein/antirepressor Ant [Bartonella krasnovii]